jgi:hypothetical protein
MCRSRWWRPCPRSRATPSRRARGDRGAALHKVGPEREDRRGLASTRVQLARHLLAFGQQRSVGVDDAQVGVAEVQVADGGFEDPVAAVGGDDDDAADAVVAEGEDDVLDHQRQGGGSEGDRAGHVHVLLRVGVGQRGEQVAVAEGLGDPPAHVVGADPVGGDGEVFAVLLERADRKDGDARVGVGDLLRGVVDGEHGGPLQAM